MSIGPYSSTRKQIAGTGFSADHIPSFASRKMMMESELGRTLTTAEEKALRNSTLTVAINTKLHQTTSQTYGGRNTNAKIAADAADPVKAIRDNVNAYRKELLKAGYTNADIDNAINTLSAPYIEK